MNRAQRAHGEAPGPSGPMPEFLAPLQEALESRTAPLLDLGHLPDGPGPIRRGAVLILIAGKALEEAAVVVEERGHTMRSQPGQFALPGGGIEESDSGAVAAALRESREEIGLESGEVQVLGPLAPITMPHRRYQLTPVLAWAPQRPAVHEASPLEVESVHWVPLLGEGSLSDPAVRCAAELSGRDAGIAFDLPEDAFIWGFTAYLLEAVRRLLLGEQGPADVGERPGRYAPAPAEGGSGPQGGAATARPHRTRVIEVPSLRRSAGGGR